MKGRIHGRGCALSLKAARRIAALAIAACVISLLVAVFAQATSAPRSGRYVGWIHHHPHNTQGLITFDYRDHAVHHFAWGYSEIVRHAHAHRVAPEKWRFEGHSRLYRVHGTLTPASHGDWSVEGRVQSIHHVPGQSGDFHATSLFQASL